MKSKIDYSLYLVTDRSLVKGCSIERAVEEAIKGGCTVIQLREKNISSHEFYEMACKIKKVTDYYKVPFIINDRADIALAVDADGVHVGNEDIPAHAVRKMIGDHKILGVSAISVSQALKAKEDGADYIGVGAIFTTKTKDDADYLSIETLKKIREKFELPIVAIGGINSKNIMLLKDTGIDGVAVISSILSKENIMQAAKNLKQLYLKNVGSI